MKVEIADLTDIEKRVTVTVPAETVDKEIESTYSEIKKNVALRGFRKGKAPRSLLERYFKPQVEEDVISKIVKDSYKDAVDKVEAQPVSQPRIENGVLEKGKDFTYSASFEVSPKIEVDGYKGLEIEKPGSDVDDEEVEKFISHIRKEQADIRDAEERSSQHGDIVVVDFEGTIDGQPFAGNSRKDFWFDPDEDVALPGFYDKLIGLKKSEETTFSLTFPENYHDTNIAGKEVQWKVIIKEIKEKHLPDLDDEFAKDIGPYNSIDEMKKDIREKLTTKSKKEAEDMLHGEIGKTLIEKNPFELPKALVQTRIEMMINDYQRMLESYNTTLEKAGQSLEQLSEQFKPRAEYTARITLILDAIAKKEEIKAEEEDFEKLYNDIAQSQGQDIALVKNKIEKNLLTPQIIQQKAMQFIIDSAKINEITKGEKISVK